MRSSEKRFFVSFPPALALVCLLGLLAVPLLAAEGGSNLQFDVNGEVSLLDHGKQDEYWSDLAAGYEPFVIDPAELRVAAPEELHELGQWGPVIAWPHIPVSAANLPDGRILTFASNEKTAFPGGRPEFTYAATWDPATEQFVENNHDSHDMFCGHLVMLEDGRVMIMGGRNHVSTVSAYDATTDAWVPMSSMNRGRWYPTAAALPDGRVFIMIGSSGGQYPEVYTPGEGFQILNGIDFQGPILDYTGHYEQNWWPLINVAPDGTLFHSGPTPKMHTIDWSGSGTLTEVGPEITSWYPKHGTTVMYDEGKLLVAGGAISGGNTASTDKAMLIDINGASPIVNEIAPMAFARKFQSGVILPNGEVMVVGGNTSGIKFNDSGSILTPELFDPQTSTWRQVADMAVPRNYHSIALLLTDGRVLAAGGGLCNSDCPADHQDGQVYSPGYLFNADGSPATRPALSSYPSSVRPGETFSVQATAGLSRFSFIKMSSATHAVNSDLRGLSLPFSEISPGQYDVSAHSNINVLTPGYWMLFGLNAQGTPSVAAVIQVSSDNGLPVVTNPGSQSDLVGDPVSLQIQASDPDGDSLTFSATGLPPGLAIDEFTGLISGTPTTSGTYSPVVSATDNFGGSDDASFTWIVSASPICETPTNVTAGGVAEQSSEYSGGSFPASLAIDGDLTNYTHTDTSDAGAWWEVTLSTARSMNEVVLHNRDDCCQGRFRDLTLTILDDTGTPVFTSAILNPDDVLDSPGSIMVDLIGETGGAVTGRTLRVSRSTATPGHLESLVIDGVDGNWTAVTTQHAYQNMVAACTVAYENNTVPVVARMRNAGGSSFEIRLQNPGDRPVVADRVHCLIADEGSWTLPDGRTFEAQRFNSTITDHSASWTGQPLSYLAAYTNPVVFGQVMTANDPDWSSFWDLGASRTDPPSSTTLRVGKHVAQDSDTARVDETLGVFVFEAGTGSANGIAYEVTLGADTVRGHDDGVYSYSFAQSFASAPTFVLATKAAEDGGDGSWAQLQGANPISATSFNLVVDEDQIRDTERNHTTEQVAFVAFEQNVAFELQHDDADANVLSLGEVEVAGCDVLNGNTPPVVTNPGDQTNVNGDSVSLPIEASDADGDVLTYSASELPTGLTIDAATGVISGMITADGTWNSTVTVNDGNSGVDSQTFLWTVSAAPPIVVEKPISPPRPTGTSITFTASATGGSGQLTYRWLFGDGTPETPPSVSNTAAHSYSSAALYAVTLTVEDAIGQTASQQFWQAIHWPHTSGAPHSSSSIAYESRTGNDRIWIANPDNDSVTVIDSVSQAKISEISVGSAPRSLAIAPDGRIWVTNKHASSISVIDADTLSVSQTIPLTYGSQPFGIVFDGAGGLAYVILEATGELLQLDAVTGAQLASVSLGNNPRHLAISHDGSQVFVSRFVTPRQPGEDSSAPQTQSGGVNTGGEVLVIDTASLAIADTVILRHSDRQDSEHSGRGVPNYLGAAAISPDGRSSWVPSKQDNILRGSGRDGNGLTHDSTVRAIASRIDLGLLSEDYPARVDLDDGAMPSAATFGAYGNYLFVALEGSREVGVLDAYGNAELFRFDVGRAPQGLVVSPDGLTLYVHNFMDRTVSALDVTAVVNESRDAAPTLFTLSTVSSETLSPQVLSGKQLFYDARDSRLAFQQYISCASCHNDGGQDGRVWDLTGFGEGLRNTINLRGPGGTAYGPLHWSANFDEIHDFEGQIRDLSGGTGLMDDADFNSGTRNTPLGDPKAGISADLDALAAYVNSLTDFDASPHRNADASLTLDGQLGRDVFKANDCMSCHQGERFTDSALGNLKDVGTIKPHSGSRLGGTLDGIDTPTLRGVWDSAPYLHDGSAATLEEAIDAHSGIAVSGADMAKLRSFLLQLDATEPMVNNPPSITNPGDQTDTEEDVVSLQISASDLDGHALTYSASGLPTGLTIGASTGLISGAVDPDGEGNYSATVTVQDAEDSTNTTFAWTILPINHAPDLLNPGDQTNDQDDAVNLPLSASDVDGDTLTYSATGLPPGLTIDPATGVISGSPSSPGTYNVTASVSDGQLTDDEPFVWTVIGTGFDNAIEFLVADGVSSSGWTTVSLGHTYTSMVVACVTSHENNTEPTVVRMRNASAGSFQLMLQDPAGSALSAERVFCLVSEEGEWQLPDGRRFEARRVVSNVTAENNNWAGQPLAYLGSYSQPVVLGQVMTYNDIAWSTFWSQGSSLSEPPSAGALTVGKHVGEDPDITRNDETLGVFVFEAGTGSLNGTPYEIALGADSVLGYSDGVYSYGFSQTFTTAPAVVVATQSAEDGGNGGFAHLAGPNPVSPASFNLVIDEDTLGDTERNHTTEQVAYLAVGDASMFEITAPPPPPQGRFESLFIDGVSSGGWTPVSLLNSYDSMVVTCSVVHAANSAPQVVRMRNAAGNGFDLRLQNPSGAALVGERVHCTVAEEGSWTMPDGRRIDARRYNSTITDGKTPGWVGQPPYTPGDFTTPVVLAQVMTYNDADWSTAWTRGSSAASPPSSGSLFVGKQIAEDPNATRADETIGLIVIESGHGTVGGIEYEAAVGADTVRGVTNGSGYSYAFGQPFATTPQVAVVTQAGMDGNNGGWAVLFGSAALTSSSITLAIDEDQVNDSERSHTTEQVAYLVFADPVNLALDPL